MEHKPTEQHNLPPKLDSEEPEGPQKLGLIYRLALLLVAVIAGYMLFTQLPSQPDKQVVETNAKAEANRQLSELVWDIEGDLRAKFAKVPSVEVKLDAVNGPGYITDQADVFYTLPSGKTGYLIKLDDKSKSDKDFDTHLTDFVSIAGERLANYKLKMSEQSSDYRHSTEYQNEMLVCSLHEELPRLLCNSRLNYPKSSDMKPYIAAIGKHDDYKDVDKPMIISLPEVQISQTVGYQIAYGVASDIDAVTTSELMYYKKTADTDWVYFGAKKDKRDCSAYDSEDAKAAFAGVSCRDDDGKKAMVGE